MSELFVGIDPSLTSTGLYIKSTNGDLHWQIDTKPKDFNGSINRCVYISNIIVQAIQQNIQDKNDVKLITIQDYFSGRQPGVVIQLAQLGTIIRYQLLKRGYPIIVAAPKKIKKFVTGNGNAKKDLMIKTVFQRWGYRAITDNLADACGMAYFSNYIYDVWYGKQILSDQDKSFFKVYLNQNCILKI